MEQDFSQYINDEEMNESFVDDDMISCKDLDIFDKKMMKNRP